VKAKIRLSRRKIAASNEAEALLLRFAGETALASVVANFISSTVTTSKTPRASRS